MAVALLQQRRSDPAGALRTLSLLAPADASPPAVALLRARLLRESGQTDAALTVLEGVVSPGAEIALERGELLAEAKRPGEALGEYLWALCERADPSETLARVQELWETGQVRLGALLTGLGEGCAVLPDPSPVVQFVATRLPAADPAVQEWLAFHAGPAMG